tara:strand:- start:170 stop:286 length:117 start_codon:yes stop_codon:yes gene_type:complete
MQRVNAFTIEEREEEKRKKKFRKGSDYHVNKVKDTCET